MTWHSELRKAAFHIAQARLAAPTIDQFAAAHMLKTIGDSYLSSAIKEYSLRRDCAVKALSRIPGVDTHPPAGGFYLVAKLPVRDAEDFAVFLLNEFQFEGATLFVAPAAGFYMHRDVGNDKIRIAFVLNARETEQAIKILGEGLKAYAERYPDKMGGRPSVC
jgi:aspartate aminotransferase